MEKTNIESEVKVVTFIYSCYKPFYMNSYYIRLEKQKIKGEENYVKNHNGAIRGKYIKAKTSFHFLLVLIFFHRSSRYSTQPQFTLFT